MPPRTTTTPRESSALRTVMAAMQSREFAPVYYLFGDNDYLKDAAIHDLLDAALEPATRDFNCDVRRGSEIDAEAVNDILGTPPMLAERRAVVIRDVNAMKKAARTRLEKYLAHPAADTMLILTSPAGAPADAVLTELSVALAFEMLSPERVRRWILHHTTSVLNATISDDAVQLMQQAVGNDLHILAGELDKCASYVLGASNDKEAPAEIDAETVAAIVGVRRGETVVDLLDAIARFDARMAVDLIPHVLSQPKMSAVSIVMMLSVQTFALAFGCSRKDAGVPTNRLPGEFFGYLKETGGFLGRPWGEATAAWTKVVDGWTTQSCTCALELLLEADIALKDTTISNSEQIFMSLVLALCALRPRARKAA